MISADDGERRAQWQAPRVAHEDLRRVDVEPEEAEQGADDQRAQDGEVGLRRPLSAAMIM